MTIDWTDNERTRFPGLKRYDASRYQSTHIQGGAIMGVSPENSVVNTRLQLWDVPNVYVLGASAWPQNPSVNPTLTALALTYRTAETI